MNDEEIVLVARLKVKKEFIEDAKRESLAMVAETRTEAGCLNYDIHQAVDDPTVLIWHETWTNQAALNEHFAKPYFTDFFAKVDGFKDEPIQINITKMITEKA